MIINHNLSAINAHRQLGISNHAGAKSLEKLSSGLRINRASDDAAGLAISEKMRGQIKGLNQASRNAQDAISLIQTAEGALNESHSIVQRMRELSVQAASDTNTASDRFQIQKEINKLSDELTRIAGTTEFNTKKLLDGNFQGTFQIGANAGQTMDLKIGDMDSASLGTTTTAAVTTVDYGSTNATTSSGFNLLTGGSYTVEVAADGQNAVLKAADGTSLGTANLADGGTSLSFTVSDTNYIAAGTGTATVTVGVSDTDGTTGIATSAGTITANVLAAGEGISVMDQDDAEAAITKINSALERISSQRSDLGAVQNRLEHTIANLNTAAENLQASESRVRDVDMAKEMMEFTRTNILQQAGTAMLAQANAKPQSVLQLLG